MPDINGKKFPYTAKGKKDAEAYAKKVKPMKGGPSKGSMSKKTDAILKITKDPLKYVKPTVRTKQPSAAKLGPAKGKPQAKTVKPSKRTTTARKLKGY